MSGAPPKYDFGTTPEAVIRKRLLGWQNRAEGNYLHSLIHLHTDPDDLLTVMGSLGLASGPFGQCSSFGSLRIEMLAALGIDESGTT